MSDTSATPAAQMGFFWIATQPSVVKRAAKIALVVGTILALINHGDAIVTGTLAMGAVFKILLTFLVPYSVSTYSSVQAIRDRMQVVATKP